MLCEALSAAGVALRADPTVVLYTYTYDANGNTLSKSDGTDSNTYVYDFENRLHGRPISVDFSLRSSATAC
jgi:YD repeat-containing protein